GKVNISGIATDRLNAECNGVGDITLSGNTKRASLECNGVGSMHADKLKCGTANVTATGVGGVTVWVDGKSTVDRSGIGNVKILGQNK
ncbi:MAG: DUF2807 domain-containing protein, partial [Muribaculaceae bacterium]|nr:DUF2807 domain-containing protein [Muribaculaceae bacterium]